MFFSPELFSITLNKICENDKITVVFVKNKYRSTSSLSVNEFWWAILVQKPKLILSKPLFIEGGSLTLIIGPSNSKQQFTRPFGHVEKKR